MERGNVNLREGKVRALLRENRRAALREERDNRRREREVQRERVPYVVVVPREDEEERRNFVTFVSNSPPVPTVARRLERERQQAQMMEMVPLNPPVNVPALVSPSVDEGVRIDILTNDTKMVPRRHVREVPVLHEAVQTDAIETAATTESRTLEWSLFQVWNNLAFSTCSVPYRVAFDEQHGKYVLKHSRLQQLLYALQTGAAFVEMLSWWRLFQSVLDGPSNPLKYVKFTGHIIKGMARICQVKTTTFGMKNVVRLHNLASEHEAATNNYRIVMSKKMTILFLIGYTIYLCGYTSLSVAVQTYLDQGDWDWGLPELIQSFACYARRKYAWVTSKDCPRDIFLSFEEIPFREYFYGGVGIYTYVSSILLIEQIALQIMTSNLTLLDMSWTLMPNHDEATVTENGSEEASQAEENPSSRYCFLEKSAVIISSFIGSLMALKLADVACGVPKCLDYIFNLHSSSAIPLAIDIFILFVAFFVACISAVQIDELQHEITQPRWADALPEDIKRLILYIRNVFSRTIGIGYRGLFVMTFPLLCTYITSIGALVAFTHEINEKEAEKNQNIASKLF